MEGIKYGHVYVARHFYLEENVYKIGYTNGSVEERMNQLSTTGVPSKFYTVLERLVPNAKKIEEKVHKKFEKQRCSDNREFFQCDSIEIMNYLNEIITEIWTRFFDEHFVFLQEGALNLTDDYKKELIKQLVLELVTNNSIPNQSLSNKIRFLDEIILMEYHYFIRDNRVYFAPIVIDMGSQGEVVDYMSTVKKMYNI